MVSNRKLAIQRLLGAVVLSAVLVVSAGVAQGADRSGSAEEARAALERGEQALRSLDYNRALSELDRAVADNVLEPAERAVALLNRGLARQNLRDYAGSIADYTESIEIGTLPAAARAIAHFNRGLAYNSLENTTKALEDLSRAIEINSSFAQAYNSRGTLMRSLGRHQEAVKDYEAAIRNRYPQPHLVYYGEALSYIALRQTAQARDALRKALDANPEFNMARDKLAEIDATIIPANATPSQMVAADPTTTQSIGGNTNTDSEEELAGADLGKEKTLDGYLVQLMAQRDREALVGAWDKLSVRHASVLGGLEPIIQKADLGERGVVYRLRTGPFAERGEAERLCEALKSRGAACFTAAAN